MASTDNYMNTMLQDDDGAIWVGTRHGLDCFRKSPIASTPIKIQNSRMSLAAGVDADLWIAENSHLTRASFADARVTSTQVYAGGEWNKPKSVAAVPLCDDMDYAVLCADRSKVVAFKHPEGVPSADVNARVCVDRNQVVWLAKDGYGVFTRSGDQWARVPVVGSKISSPRLDRTCRTFRHSLVCLQLKTDDSKIGSAARCSSCRPVGSRQHSGD